MKAPTLPVSIVTLGTILAAIASLVLFVVLDPLAAAAIVLLGWSSATVVAALILRAVKRASTDASGRRQ